MAEVSIPLERRPASWLDRPVAPSWLRLTAILAHREAIAYAVILAVGLLLRVWGLGDRAMHHDESLHAYYSWQFFTGKGYSYDPLMHGPLQFEVVPLFYLMFGAGEFSARLFAAVCGTVLIILPFFLRRYLTRPGAVLASLMIAISPGLVYFSRFIRDDMYLVCFATILFISIVRYLETHRSRYFYAGAAALALAFASMEAAYLLVFIFGSFLVLEALREYLSDRQGPVIQAVRATSIDTWLTGIAVFVVLTVLFYSTFFTNPYGIWDTSQALFSNGAGCGLQGDSPLGLNPCRKDIIGGLIYWLAQHKVDRGGQPWFYYLLVLPLYEQLAVLFGVAGAVYACVRRSLVTSFLVWWATMSLLLYSWAGEKMPWLSVHIIVPLILLAGLFLGKILMSVDLRRIVIAGVLFVPLFALETHSTFALSFQDAANPTEMYIYVQTAQDVPAVVHEIAALSRTRFGGTSMPIGLDNADVGGWPFIWYLRDYPNLFETQSFSGPACGTQYCPVLVMLGPEYDQYAAQLQKHYVVQQYRWNWWFPEDYKQWFPEHPGTILPALVGQGSISADPVGTPTDWQHLWNWLIYRTPFGDRGARMMYFLVRKDLVPHASQYASTLPPGAAAPVATAAPMAPVRSLAATLVRSFADPALLSGPRGLTVAPNGNSYIADPLTHRVVELSPSGSVLNRWGSTGTGPGQFSSNDSPLGVAVGRNGDVYVADTWNQRIQVFSPSGKFLRQWGGGPIGSGPGQFFGPRSLAIDAHGNVYVADTGNKRIQVFTSAGKFLRTLGTAGSGPGQFNEPSSVAIGPNGDVYVSDFWNQRMQELTATGAFVRSWSVSDWQPQTYNEPYVTVDRKSGEVFVSDPTAQRVLVWTSRGKSVGAIAVGSSSLPVGVATRPNGDLEVGDATSGRISTYRFSSKKVPAPKHHKHR